MCACVYKYKLSKGHITLPHMESFQVEENCIKNRHTNFHASVGLFVIVSDSWGKSVLQLKNNTQNEYFCVFLFHEGCKATSPYVLPHCRGDVCLPWKNDG